MTIKERIDVVNYNPQWPAHFAEEAERIKRALGDNCIRIHHIGSTAVPGLAAKPVIDMLPVVHDISKVDDALSNMEQLGYVAKGEFGMPFRRYFQKGQDKRTHNVHVFEEKNPEIERHLKFRDWLQTHPADRDAYAELKRYLAQQNPTDIMAYSLGKEAFIAHIDKQTGYQGIRMVKAMSTREWEAVARYRYYYFLNKNTGTDPYRWSFEHPEHTHFVLYHSADIVAYAHLQFWPNKQAALRLIVVDETYQKQGIGSQLLSLCERWLQQQGYQSVHVESTPEATNFFVKHGYVDRPCYDPDKRDAGINNKALGKSFVPTE